MLQLLVSPSGFLKSILAEAQILLYKTVVVTALQSLRSPQAWICWFVEERGTSTQQIGGKSWTGTDVNASGCLRRCLRDNDSWFPFSCLALTDSQLTHQCIQDHGTDNLSLVQVVSASLTPILWGRNGTTSRFCVMIRLASVPPEAPISA